MRPVGLLMAAVLVMAGRPVTATDIKAVPVVEALAQVIAVQERIDQSDRLVLDVYLRSGPVLLGIAEALGGGGREAYVALRQVDPQTGPTETIIQVAAADIVAVGIRRYPRALAVLAGTATSMLPPSPPPGSGLELARSIRDAGLETARRIGLRWDISFDRDSLGAADLGAIDSAAQQVFAAIARIAGEPLGREALSALSSIHLAVGPELSASVEAGQLTVVVPAGGAVTVDHVADRLASVL